MGGIFGGNTGDNGEAERINQQNIEAQNRATAAAAAAKKESDAQIAQQKAEAEKAATDLSAKNDAAIKQSEKDAAQQAQARAQTGGGVSFDNTRSDAAKALAVSQTNKGAGLPGFNSMLPPAPAGGFAGQSNSLSSQTLAGKSGFNTQLPGGRRYA